jgi:hypothetical protein
MRGSLRSALLPLGASDLVDVRAMMCDMIVAGILACPSGGLYVCIHRLEEEEEEFIRIQRIL